MLSVWIDPLDPVYVNSISTIVPFNELCTDTLQLESTYSLAIAGEDVHSYIQSKLVSNPELQTHWISLFPETVTLPTCDADEERVLTLVKVLFAEVTVLFTKVMINQFRKDLLLTAMRDHKSLALRSEK